MRWKTGRRSTNIEDRRGRRAAPVVFKGGIGTIVLVLAASYFLGINPLDILMMQTGTDTGYQQTDRQPTPQEQELADFVSVVLADTEDTWTEIFRQAGRTYEEPRLVLYSGAVQSACGMGAAAMGPFYCPSDRKVYIDLAFFDELRRRHGAPGDFAQAYAIAHEVGHHVQNLLGISDRVSAAQHGLGAAEVNGLSVKLELQADCFAGVWGYHADRSRQVLEAGDIEEALTAASAIGDDRLQQEGRGYVVPETFTHGTSRQRVEWFKRGIEHGDIASCDTFASG
jgi:predicted metalloprotease